MRRKCGKFFSDYSDKESQMKIIIYAFVGQSIDIDNYCVN
jgi:hypothetical protein